MAGEAAGAGVPVMGVDGTPAGLATGVPPVVITVGAFWGVAIFTDTGVMLGATASAFCKATDKSHDHHQADLVTHAAALALNKDLV